MYRLDTAMYAEGMSRPRTRPTRDQTKQRLFAAAADVFSSRGIGGASIDAIAEAAGFSRGAFYSNFGSKDDLIIEMLADHAEFSAERNRRLLEHYRDPVDFVAASRTEVADEDDLLGRLPLLHMELILYVARSKERRPELAERLKARRELIAEIIAVTNKSAGPGQFVDPSWAQMLLALEDGFRLHRLIDPEGTSEDAFLVAVQDLQRAIGIDSTAAAP
jgi:AcrR family transcriptional regulator